MRPEGILPWHFDSCEFTLSIMIQKPDEGGIFEYCPFIREPGNENFDEVKKVLEGDRTKVRQLKLEPGDLQIFKGRFTMHRVTKVKGNKAKISLYPSLCTRPLESKYPRTFRSYLWKSITNSYRKKSSKIRWTCRLI
jgi:hypothetical protein